MELATEEQLRRWRSQGRDLCGLRVAVTEEGKIDWLRNSLAFGEFAERAVMHTEVYTEEQSAEGAVTSRLVEGLVRTVVMLHGSAKPAVCYVEFPDVGGHKLLTAAQVREGIALCSRDRRSRRSQARA